MKNVARVVVLGLMLLPVAAVVGCGARRCNSEPVMQHKLEKLKTEYGGK